MILSPEIISSIVSYERENIIFHGKNLRLTKNNTFNNVFAIEFFLTITPHQFFKND